MKPIKIVVIGAGSASFGFNTLACLLREPELRGSTVALMDINPEALGTARRLANRINAEWDAGVTILSATDRVHLLPDADFVICSIEVGWRPALWRLDFRIPLKHGVRQPFAENGGPGGFAHTARQVPAVLDIARDMERLCPEAWLLNFSNPVPRLTRAITKYTPIKTVGLCHQIGFAYRLAGRLLADVLDVEPPRQRLEYGSHDWFTWMPIYTAYAEEVERKLDIKAVGINHFTWILSMHDRRDGADVYPEFMRRFEQDDAEPLMRDMMHLTGLCPTPGDQHLAEYLPFSHNPVTKPWKRYGINPRDFCFAENESEVEERTKLMRALVRDLADGKHDLDPAKGLLSEGVWEIVHGITTDDRTYRLSANVPNSGALLDLPPESVVEIPVNVDASGITGLAMGRLPLVVTELLRRETVVAELVVDAAVQGDKQVALQALMMDPMVDDYDVAKSILKDFLKEEALYLPQFHGEWKL